MAETPATRSSLQRTPPASLPYKLEIDQLKRRLALVAGGTDAAELTALLAAREDDVARLCQENAQLRQGAPPPRSRLCSCSWPRQRARPAWPREPRKP